MSWKTWKGAASVACLGAAAMWAQPASATNGYFVNGFDTTSQGMAGAGLTEGDGPVSSAANPAVGIKMGNIAGGCVSAFMPNRKADIGTGSGLAAGEYTSKENLFFIPCAGANTKIGDNNAVGVTLVANGGMNTYYESNPFKNISAKPVSSPTGINLEQAFISLNGAHKVTDNFAIGLAPVFAVQEFRAYGLEAFDNANVSTSPGNVTGNGDDWSFGGGLRVGGVWDTNKYLSVAVAYQSRMWMSKFSKYRGLFAESGGFDIPPELSAGITVRPISTVALMFDYNRIFYGDIASISNSELGFGPGGTAGALGANNGMGFGWKDMNVFHFGAQWQATDALTLRTGYSHASNAFNGDQAEFNILAPGIVKDHLSVGASYKFAPHWTVDGAYTHAFNNTVNGTSNPSFGNPPNSTQPINLSMSQEIATVGLSYRW